jgi:hypothetical protein
VFGHEGQPGGGEQPLRGAPLRRQARPHQVDQLLRAPPDQRAWKKKKADSGGDLG